MCAELAVMRAFSGPGADASSQDHHAQYADEDTEDQYEFVALSTVKVIMGLAQYCAYARLVGRAAGRIPPAGCQRASAR